MRNVILAMALIMFTGGCATITRDGYETVNASVTSSVDGGGAAGMAGNVLLGGIIGAGVDAGSGAMHSHKPNPLVVTLTPLDPARREPAEEAMEEAEGGAAHGGMKNKEVED